jgi:hypothetical protein
MKKKVVKFDFDGMMAWEDGQLSEADEIKFFQAGVNSGQVWHLQGMYGRRAHDLIEAGLVKLPKNKKTFDAYGNRVS